MSEFDHEPWEYDFSPLGEHVVSKPRFTQCAVCGRCVPQEHAVRSQTDDYCSPECRKADLYRIQATEGGF